MSNCTSGCVTQDHESYGACLQAKGLRVAYCNSVNGSDYASQKKWDKDLDAYSKVRKEGIQPAGTKRSQVDLAMRVADNAGMAAVAK